MADRGANEAMNPVIRAAQAQPIPSEFLCPISGQVMRDPVWLETGVACDRKYAEAYLYKGNTICPVTGDRLTSKSMVPVSFLKGLIKRWAQGTGYDLKRKPAPEAVAAAVAKAAEAAREAAAKKPAAAGKKGKSSASGSSAAAAAPQPSGPSASSTVSVASASTAAPTTASAISATEPHLQHTLSGLSFMSATSEASAASSPRSAASQAQAANAALAASIARGYAPQAGQAGFSTSEITPAEGKIIEVMPAETDAFAVLDGPAPGATFKDWVTAPQQGYASASAESTPRLEAVPQSPPQSPCAAPSGAGPSAAAAAGQGVAPPGSPRMRAAAGLVYPQVPQPKKKGLFSKMFSSKTPSVAPSGRSATSVSSAKGSASSARGGASAARGGAGGRGRSFNRNGDAITWGELQGEEGYSDYSPSPRSSMGNVTPRTDSNTSGVTAGLVAATAKSGMVQNLSRLRSMSATGAKMAAQRAGLAVGLGSKGRDKEPAAIEAQRSLSATGAEFMEAEGLRPAAVERPATGPSLVKASSMKGSRNAIVAELLAQGIVDPRLEQRAAASGQSLARASSMSDRNAIVAELMSSGEVAKGVAMPAATGLSRPSAYASALSRHPSDASSVSAAIPSTRPQQSSDMAARNALVAELLAAGEVDASVAAIAQSRAPPAPLACRGARPVGPDAPPLAPSNLRRNSTESLQRRSTEGLGRTSMEDLRRTSGSGDPRRAAAAAAAAAQLAERHGSASSEEALAAAATAAEAAMASGQAASGASSPWRTQSYTSDHSDFERHLSAYAAKLARDSPQTGTGTSTPPEHISEGESVDNEASESPRSHGEESEDAIDRALRDGTRAVDMQEMAGFVRVLRKGGTVTDLLELLGIVADMVQCDDLLRRHFRELGGCPALAKLAAHDSTPLRVAIARVCWYTSRNAKVAAELTECNLVPILLTALHAPDCRDRLPLIAALCHLSVHYRGAVPLDDRALGVINKELLQAGSTEDALAAASTIHTAYEAALLPKNQIPGQVPGLKLLHMLASLEAAAALAGLTAEPHSAGVQSACRLMGVLSQNIPGMAAEFHRRGVVPRLVKLLACKSHSGRSAAAQALAKLIAAFPDCRSAIRLEDAIPRLCAMLRASDTGGCEAAAWLTGYVTVDPPTKRVAVKLGAAAALTDALRGGSPDAREGAAWALANLAAEPSNVRKLVTAGVLGPALAMLRLGKPYGRDSCLAVIGAIARDGGGTHVNAIGVGGLKRVVSVLLLKPAPDNEAAREAALGVVRALCTQQSVINQPMTAALVELGGIKPIVHLLKHASDGGRDSAAWALAEMTVLPPVAAATRSAKAVPRLVEHLNGGSYAGREAAAVALYHLCVNNIGVQGELVKLHGLVGLNQLLLTGGAPARVGAARVVGALAASPDFQKNAARQGVVVNTSQMLAAREEEVRIAAAEALAQQGSSNLGNWVLMQKGVPLLAKMLASPSMPEIEAAARALTTVAHPDKINAATKTSIVHIAKRLRAEAPLSAATAGRLDFILGQLKPAVAAARRSEALAGANEVSMAAITAYLQRVQLEEAAAGNSDAPSQLRPSATAVPLASDPNAMSRLAAITARTRSMTPPATSPSEQSPIARSPAHLTPGHSPAQSAGASPNFSPPGSGAGSPPISRTATPPRLRKTASGNASAAAAAPQEQQQQWQQQQQTQQQALQRSGSGQRKQLSSGGGSAAVAAAAQLHRSTSGARDQWQGGAVRGAPNDFRQPSLKSHSLEAWSDPPLPAQADAAAAAAARARASVDPSAYRTAYPAAALRASAPARTSHPAAALPADEELPTLPPELQNYTLFPGQAPPQALERRPFGRRRSLADSPKHSPSHAERTDDLQVVPRSMSFGDDDDEAEAQGYRRRHSYRPPPLEFPDGRSLYSHLLAAPRQAEPAEDEY